MGLTVTAEGVENADALQSLSTLGCHYAQGFHLAYPMSADAIHALFVSPPTA
jgi:EAL domain-containing protein (putative c-di-GMP-specific phosphodiesterase class I)